MESGTDWRPRASPALMRRRMQLYRTTRDFFAERGVAEVETPLLCRYTATDRHLHSFAVETNSPPAACRRFLQTSPEFAMKRLLAADFGAVFQICKAFRRDEAGSQHNPEFSMLEWYRPGLGYHQLMDEVSDYLAFVAGFPAAERETYSTVFARHIGYPPHIADEKRLAASALALGLVSPDRVLDRDGWLDLLMSFEVEPRLGRARPLILYDYPATQAALSVVRDGVPPVAERFEVFVNGIELANGYQELTDADEQWRRAQLDQTGRRTLGLEELDADPRLLAALPHLPVPCAGVALGLDRLLMLSVAADDLSEVLAFPWSVA